MPNDRRCIKCGNPLTRNKREADRDWSKRQFCNRRCYGGNRSVKPIWLTFAENTAKQAGGCIIWTGYTDPKGYGRFSSHGGEVLAHRLAYSMHFGADVKGWHVLHRCDNRRCVNPQHLFLGTNDDNMADMVAKGRASRRFGTQNPNYRHGRNCAASPRRAQIQAAMKEREQ